MKKIGMIGGFGPESTLEYYKLIMEIYRQKIGSNSLPEIVINSLDVYELVKMIEQQEWDAIANWILDSINDLFKAGAEFGFISANTPHIVFNLIKDQSPIPLISIVEEAGKKVESLGINKVALLGTKFTMESNFYQEVFDKLDISIVVPDKQEQEYINNKIINEIEIGIFLNETRNELLRIIQRIIESEQIEVVILGCTELSLILTKDHFGIPFINTTKVHVESIIEYYKQ